MLDLINRLDRKLILTYIAWLFVVRLMFVLFPDNPWFIVVMTLSAILRTIEEIGDHKPKWTWLNKWFVEKKKGRIVDGYHISFYLMRYFFLWGGALFIDHGGSLLHLALISPILWAYDGYTSNTFYHVGWMKRIYREYHRVYYDFVDFYNWLRRKFTGKETDMHGYNRYYLYDLETFKFMSKAISSEAEALKLQKQMADAYPDREIGICKSYYRRDDKKVVRIVPNPCIGNLVESADGLGQAHRYGLERFQEINTPKEVNTEESIW